MPIHGTRKIARLDENAQAVHIALDASEIARIRRGTGCASVSGTRYPADGMSKVNV